jgi:hypothetical protein
MRTIAIFEAAGVCFVVASIWRIWNVHVIVADCVMTVIALLCACGAIAQIKVPVLSIKPVFLMIDAFGLACSTMMMHVRCPMLNETHWVTWMFSVHFVVPGSFHRRSLTAAVVVIL